MSDSNKEKAALRLVGLAKAGGNVKSGETGVLEAIRDGSAELVIIATDASEGTSKKFKDKSSYYEVPVLVFATKESLAHSIGRDYVAVVAVTERGLAGKITEIIEK